jgi:hypothetical protein
MVVRALVTLYSLRKFYDGKITFYVEEEYPHEMDEALKYFGCDIVHNEIRHDLKTLVRKNSLFENPPYDLTLWLDIDTVIVGKIDEMFNYLEEKQVDFCIPHFCAWISNGHHISERINRFKGLIDDKYIKEALNNHPAINTGILSFRKSDKWNKFVRDWTDLADRASKKHIFIPDEVSCQILYPSMHEYGLKYFIAPTDFNVSPLHDHGVSKDPRIKHHHGDKHVLNVTGCDEWKSTFKEMCESNIANINSFLKYADKRLKVYLNNKDGISSDVTIVTACDPYYVEILKHTFPNWRKYKGIDKNPVIVFVNGMELADTKLDFLRLPNVQLISWSKEKDLDNVTEHREEMLSAFVLGAAKYVQTEYWMKLDADSYATDNKPFVTDAMRNYSVFSHKWGYSRPEHVRKLDEWSKTCWHKKINDSKPMIEQGRIEGNRFYHNSKRFISYICFQKTRYTKYCVKLLKERRLPCPSQDTFAYYCIQKLKPEAMGIGNFKRDHGFTQGRGKMGADYIKKCVEEVDKINLGNHSKISEETSEGWGAES